jgi:hypothetical protein
MHSALVLLSWRKLYGRWPSLWQVCCIFLHDIGHFGLDYLDDHEQKKRHWELGAVVARRLFGEKGWELTAGHCSHSRRPQSDLYRADKYSWYIAPTWWLWWNNVAEPKLTTNCESNMDAVRKFRDMVKQSIESGEYVSTHSMYLSRVSGEEKQI